MPIVYSGKRSGGSATLPGGMTEGALQVFRGGTLASLQNGDPGQLLTIDERGSPAWITPMPGTAESLPIAGALLGLVRSSAPGTENGIVVDADGYMRVSSVNIATLFVDEGSDWILNGGNATR